MKNRKRILKWVVLILLLLSIAFLVLPHFLIRDWNDLPQPFGNRIQVMYYSFGILGSIGTCLAVVIALFSEEQFTADLLHNLNNK